MAAKILCPLMKIACVEDGAVVDGEMVKCRLWVKVGGMNPQTGERFENSDCSWNWVPMLLIENSAEQRKTQGEINAMRNEAQAARAQEDKNMQQLAGAMMAAVNPAVLKDILEHRPLIEPPTN